MPAIKYLKSKTTLALGVLILCFFSYNLFQTMQQQKEIAKEIDDLKNQVTKSQQENSELQKLITYLNSTAYIEEIARAELGLKKGDESVAIIPSRDILEVNSAKRTTANKQNIQSNPRKWLYYFTK